MARTYFHDFYREAEDGTETKVTVEFTMTPAIPATWDDPAEGGEVEIVKAHTDAEGWGAKISDAEVEKWTLWLMENYETDDDGPDE